jgi:hypothetical protein
MGAWGFQVFENDGAMDFAATVTDGGGITAVEDAFDQVIEIGDDYLESSVAEEALMAAEILARLNGQPGPQSSYFKEIDAWVAHQRTKPAPALIDKARRAVKRILSDNSEIVELWQDSDEFEGWKASVESVQARL